MFLEGYATSIVKVIIIFYDEEIYSISVYHLRYSSAGQREKEERDATYTMVHQEHLQWRHLHLREDPGSLDLSSNPGHHLRVCRAVLGEGD